MSSENPGGVNSSSLSGSSPSAVSSQTPVPGQPPGGQRVSVRSTAQKALSRRRYTPYGRTPGSRRIEAIERDFPRTPTEEENPPCFAGLVGVTWRVYKVTPLYHFKTTESHLKKYGRLLAAFMEAERRKGLAVDVEEQTADKVDLSQYPGLQLTQDDPGAIQLLMRGRDKYGNGELRVVLTAYLLGVEMEEGLEPGLQREMVHYPVMLVKGAIGLARLMADWFKLQFDCSVSPLLFSALDLTWISAMWSGKLTGGSNKPVELVYSLPPGCDGLSKITLTINPEDCKEVWDCIHDKRHKDVMREEVSAYLTSLENHFYHLFKIKLAAMQLTRVGTSVAYVGAEGKVKLFSEDNVLLILRHVTCLALEQLGKFG